VSKIVRTLAVTGALVSLCIPLIAWPKPSKTNDSAQLRAEYISRLQQQVVSGGEPRTLGSLWTPNSSIGLLSSDYKARNVNDVVIIQVSVATNSQQSGSLTSQRSFQTSSAITGLPGGIPTHGVNPLLNANSSTQLKGQGQAAANSTVQTNLAATVIALLGNGNLVIEGQRSIYMNNQHENAIVRGVVRPGDISTNNTVPTSALANLEIELKGKGIISDSTRPPNPITRAVLWLLGF
jgi:flagellar L-ring protein precursor FlgH